MRRNDETVGLRDTYDLNEMTATRRIFDEDEQSVEPNPTIERTRHTKHQYKGNVENCE